MTDTNYRPLKVDGGYYSNGSGRIERADTMYSGVSVKIKECQLCGAVVIDTARHNAFHDLPPDGDNRGVRLLDPFEDDNVRAAVEYDAAQERSALKRELERELRD